MEIPKVVEDYLKAEAAKGQKPTIFDFVQLHTEVIQNTPTGDPCQFWTAALSSTAKRLNIELGKSKQKVQWKALLKAAEAEEESAVEIASEQNPSRKRSRSTGSTTDSLPVTQMRDRFIQAYKSMNDDDKWKLSDGVYVEDLIYLHGLRSTDEHSAHSFIFDVDDACWNDIISPAQMNEIKAAGIPGFPKYNQDVKDIIDALSSVVKETRAAQLSSAANTATDTATNEKKIIDAVWKKITSYGFFDPDNQVDQHWLQKTMIEILDLYRWNVASWVADHGSEMDFVVRIWSMLDKAFDSLEIETRRDQTSVATVLNSNQERAFTGFGPVDTKLPSIRPDLILFRNGSEYGAAECGKEDEIGISKEQIVESQLHLPKTLKIMFNHAASRGNNKVSLIRTLRAVGLQQHHLHMCASVLDSPGGYVCRLRSTPQFEVSTRPSLMTSGLFQILKLTLKVKEAVRSSFLTVENHMTENGDEEPDLVCDLSKSSTLILPAVANSSDKKQKTTT